ncbi:MAG: LLM class F420-dependent oxidoreductase [Gammaproteobacteria bacterium]|nr:LLM class F420-dependent oxidoreductase [Gammaproteobacteria bacterium]|tara:strand:- start:820 stop:1848 length:1029 start_codon:yes stop_codon:yes gene_type:complete
MKLAIGTGVGGNRQPDVGLVQRAEALGFDSVWSGETWGTDAFSPLAFIAAVTERIKLGTSIVHVDGRTPATTAMTAQTIDAMAGGGRMLLGIGTSGPQVVEGWHGQPWGKPNYRLRDNVAIMRKVWSGERVEHQGREIVLPYESAGAIGLGKPLRNAMRDVPDIPILIGAETDLNVRMTGEIADGLLTLHTVPRQVEDVRVLLAQGVAKRTDGKTLDDLELVSGVSVVVTDDVQGAIDAAKRGIALYAGGFGARDMNFHKDAFAKRGYAAEADRIQELFLGGRRDEAAAAVPDEYVDEEILIGPPARIRERFALWRDSGFTTLRVSTDREDVLELVARENDR